MEGETKDDEKKTSVEGETQAWEVEGKTQTSQVAKPSSYNEQKAASMEGETEATEVTKVEVEALVIWWESGSPIHHGPNHTNSHEIAVTHVKRKQENNENEKKKWPRWLNLLVS
uniref:Uncharacterized protein n=1 Tax=Nelumbo nucifera TaxID=4432 RepID=A0A822ZN17_NELNU|nr:TPA_asm: hypothetical protein HUJ06_004517 [Nelumbo nucifera]